MWDVILFPLFRVCGVSIQTHDSQRPFCLKLTDRRIKQQKHTLVCSYLDRPLYGRGQGIGIEEVSNVGLEPSSSQKAKVEEDDVQTTVVKVCVVFFFFFLQSITVLALIRTSSILAVTWVNCGIEISPFSFTSRNEKEHQLGEQAENVSGFRSFRKGADATGSIMFCGSCSCYCCESSLRVP